MSATYATARRGEDHYNAKLTADDVRLIRELAEERRRIRDQLQGITNKAIAEKFGIKKTTVERVIARQVWSHVE